MARTRDIIEEIAEIRQRRRFGVATAELLIRLFALEHAFAKHDKADEELTRYFPVAIIACVEAYLRMAIQDLIDAGEPFLSNAERAAATLKLDFEVLRAVHGKAITVGELIAHSVSLSRLDHIDSTLSGLLGTGFLAGLRITTNRWANEVMGRPSAPILADPDAVFADVARTFELRHIICHEIASAYPIKSDEVERCFKSCLSFLRAADEFISEALQPGAPLTQTDMNIVAGDSLERARERLDAALAKLHSRLDAEESAALDKSQSCWQAYCDAWARFAAGRATGGTIWPLIYAKTAEDAVQRRIEEVEKFRRLGEDDNGL